MRKSWLKTKYGITPAAYEELLVAQRRVCAICQTPHADSREFRLHVDHDHVTGRVRGLLCGSCNRGLGSLRDDPTIVARALDYLRAGAPS